MGDIESGKDEYIYWQSETEYSTQSEFESTEEESPSLKKSFPKNNEEWAEYVDENAHRLIKKCRRRGKLSSWYASIFTYANDITNMYIIFFSLATFIISSIKTSYDPTDYILIGLGGVATILESAQTLFKYKKRSIYFKQASLQYKRIYRRVNKYLYTAPIDKMAEFLSLAYQNVDKLTLNDHRANFNKFKTFDITFDKGKQKERYTQ